MNAGLKLHAQLLGDGPPLLILHGLFGSGRNWGGIARRLADRFHVHLLDARNHGASPWADSMTYPEMAEDVGAYIDDHALGAVTLIGHSMGGKTAMALALTRPNLARRLIVVDIAPVAYRHGAQDSYDGYVAGMKALDLTRITRRAEAETALGGAIPDDSMRSFIVQNLESRGDHYRWRINLDAIGANLPNLIGFPPFAEPFDGPTMVIAGELSNYVRPRDEPEIKRLFPRSTLAVVEGAGHWLHADQPDRLMVLLDQELRTAS